MIQEIHYLAGCRRLARATARELGITARLIARHRFPDGEILVRVRPPARRVALCAPLHAAAAELLPALLAVDALRRAGAQRVTLVAPYLPYMRQDAVFHAGEPLSQRVLARLLSASFDAVVTVEAHLHRVTDLAAVFACPAWSVSAAPVLADLCGRMPGAVVVGPDAESERWVHAVARRAGRRFAVARKLRRGDRDVAIELPELGGARRALLVDDIASSGATLARTARALRRAGVAKVDAAVVHAIFAPGAAERIRRAGVARLVSCDTVPHPTNRLAVAPLLARALRRA